MTWNQVEERSWAKLVIDTAIKLVVSNSIRRENDMKHIAKLGYFTVITLALTVFAAAQQSESTPQQQKQGMQGMQGMQGQHGNLMKLTRRWPA